MNIYNERPLLPKDYEKLKNNNYFCAQHVDDKQNHFTLDSFTNFLNSS